MHACVCMHARVCFVYNPFVMAIVLFCLWYIFCNVYNFVGLARRKLKKFGEKVMNSSEQRPDNEHSQPLASENDNLHSKAVKRENEDVYSMEQFLAEDIGAGLQR